MTEETGIVKSVDGISAIVIIQKSQGGCGTCCSGCDAAKEGLEVEALNPVGAEVGQRVRIAFKPYDYIKGVLLVYGIPMVLFILGAIIGKRLGELYVPQFSSDLVSAASAFAVLALSYLVLQFWSKKASTGKGTHPVIESIIDDNQSTQCNIEHRAFSSNSTRVRR
jgi:sigma-E factor negative regulatory protein RseC